MAPRKQALAQSESKTRFFERLGLDENNDYHRRLYAMMKEEAVEGRRRMTEDQEALLPELRGEHGVEPPYSHAHVSETAIHREILRIYRRARPDTRQIYDLGRDVDRAEEENWIIRWMLWHVFRYRDNRNKTRRPLSGSSSSGTSVSHIATSGSRTAPVVISALGSKPTDSRTTGHMGAHPQYAVTVRPPASVSTAYANVNTTRYWDPVRQG